MRGFRTLIVAVSCCVSCTAAEYKVLNRFSIPGTDGWDYITVDSEARRIYVAHGVRVNALDADTGAKEHDSAFAS